MYQEEEKKENDLFAAYDCLVNDRTQKRFVTAVKSVRKMIEQQKAQGILYYEVFPSPTMYLGAISSLLAVQIENKDVDGLDVLLRLLHIAMNSAKLDASIAQQLFNGLIPFLDTAKIELSIALCPSLIDLCQAHNEEPARREKMVEFLCQNVFQNESRLRNAAGKAIYDYPKIHVQVFQRLFQIIENNPLRALTVIINIAPSMKEELWTSTLYETILKLCSNANRDIQVKALEILSIGMHYLQPAQIESHIFPLILNMTSQTNESAVKIVAAIVGLIRSTITRLSKSDPVLLSSLYPDLLAEMLLLWTKIDDEETSRLINQVILYGIHVILGANPPIIKDEISGTKENQPVIKEIISKLYETLSVNRKKIWPHVYEILATLPEKFGAETILDLKEPLMASLIKYDTDKDDHFVLNFIVSILNEIGLMKFFDGGLTLEAQNLLPFDIEDPRFSETVIPILREYRGKRHFDDFEWTQSKLLPIEDMLYNASEDNTMKNLWGSLWNVLPYCCTANYDISDFAQSVCIRFNENSYHLCRPVSKLFQVIARNISGAYEVVFNSLIDAVKDASTSAIVVPAISTLSYEMRSNPDLLHGLFHATIESKFTRLEEKNEKDIEVASVLIDVLFAMLQYVNDAYRRGFYGALSRFAFSDSVFQKKGLSFLSKYIDLFGIPDPDELLRNILQLLYPDENLEGVDPYQAVLSLLSTPKSNQETISVQILIYIIQIILKIPNVNREAILTNYIPAFVIALKDPGQRTRNVAEEALLQITKNILNDTPLVTILAKIAPFLTSQDSTEVSAGIEAINILIAKYFDKIVWDDLYQLNLAIWNSTTANENTQSEVFRSALKYVSTLIRRLPKYIKDNELGNLCILGLTCSTKSNWEIQGKGRKIITKLIDEFEELVVSKAVQDSGCDIKLYRSIRKEHNRDTRKKSSTNTETNTSSKGSIDFQDEQEDAEIHDLNDPSLVLAHRKKVEEREPIDDLIDPETNRIKLEETPRTKRNKPAEEGSDDEENDESDEGNEIAEHIRNKRKQQQKKATTKDFVAESGNKFKSSNGKGDRMRKGQQKPFAFAPISSKVVNKRLRGQMKAAYRQMFSKK